MRRLAAILVLAVLATGCSWAQLGFDAANTRNNAFERLLPNAINVGDVAGLAAAWSVPVVADADDYSVSAAVVGGGRVFVTSGVQSVEQPGHLHAFAVSDGTPLWTATLGDVTIAQTPVLSGDKVIASFLGGVAAFDANGVVNCTGTAPDRMCQPLWQTTQVQVGDTTVALGDVSTPTVANGVVFLTTNWTVALRVSDGAPLWVGVVAFGPEPQAASGTPAVSNGKVFVKADNFFSAHYVVAFDATRQQPCTDSPIPGICLPIWAAVLGVSSAVTYAGPSIASGRVFHPGGDTFDATGAQNCGGPPTSFCTPLWRVDVSAPPHVFAGQAVANDKLFVTRPRAGTDNDRVFELDASGTAGCGGNPKACTSVREYLLGAELPSDEVSPPTIANGVLYVGAVNRITAFDANGVAGCTPMLPTPTCRPLLQLSVAGSPATVTVFAGTLFVTFNGALHAYRLPPR